MSRNIAWDKAWENYSLSLDAAGKAKATLQYAYAKHLATINAGTMNSIAQGRNSPICKNYTLIKNPCFVTCVNSAFCS
jgi:hypothetical protein